MADPDKPVAIVADFPLPGNGWAILNDRMIVRISGPGTDKFLQGQFSQNLSEVTSDRSPRAAASTPKGRAYCLTRMIRDGDDILMELPAALAEDTLAHLRKYLMLFRGTSMEVDPQASLIGLLGEEAARALAGAPMDTLKEPGDSLALAAGFLVRAEPTAEGTPRFEFWQTSGNEAGLETTTQLPAADWYASEIAAGVASLTAATQESFVPQMLNWQHLGGVHFRKGCYTGQEVIARMHFLGQLKKSLFRFRIEQAGPVPAPGSALLAGDRSVGEVVNAVEFRDGRCELLAVVRHDAAKESLRPEGQPDTVLVPMPLPYTVPEREKSPQSDT